MKLFNAAILLVLATAATSQTTESWEFDNPNNCGCSIQTRLICEVTAGEDRLVGMDCINPIVGGEINPFFAGEGEGPDEPCTLEPSTVEITYEICNGDIQNDLILDQEKTQLKYDSTDITPISIFANTLAPDECVKFVHEVTWDMCDVPDVVQGSGDIGERVFPYSITAEGNLVGDPIDPPSKGKGGSKGGSKGKGSKSSKSSKSKGGSKGGSKGKGSKSSKSSKSKGGAYSKGYDAKGSGRRDLQSSDCYCYTLRRSSYTYIDGVKTEPPAPSPSGPSKGKGSPSGPSKGKGSPSGPSKGKDPISGPSKGKDPISGPSKGKDPMYGPSKGKDPMYGPSKGKDPMYGPSKGKDRPSGPGKGKGKDRPSSPSKGKGKGSPSSPTQPTVPDDPINECVDENWEVAILDIVITCSDIGYGKLCELSNASGIQGNEACCVCKNEPVLCPTSASTPDSTESPTPSPTAEVTKDAGLISALKSIDSKTGSSSASDAKKFSATFVAFTMAALALA